MTAVVPRGWWSPDRVATESIRDLAAEATADVEQDCDELSAGVAEAHSAGGASRRTAGDRLRQWRLWVEWAAAASVDPLPAHPRYVAAFLMAYAQAGAAGGTVHNLVRAVRWVHSEAGYGESALDDEAMTLPRVLASITSDTAGRSSRQARPVDLDELGTLLRRDHRRRVAAQREAILVTSRALRLPVAAVARATVERDGPTVVLRPGLGHDEHRLPVLGLPHYTAFGMGQPLDPGSHLDALLHRTRDGHCLGITEAGNHNPNRIITGVAEWTGVAAREVWRPVDDLNARRQLRAMDRWLLKRLRDDALLVLCWFGALRMEEARAATVHDWTHAEARDEGVGFRIPRSKTDPTGGGAFVVIPQGGDGTDLPIDPVAIIDRWVAASQLGDGEPLFPPMQKGAVPVVPEHHTTIASLVRTLKAAGARIDSDERISGHSMRRGWGVEASRQGVPVHERMAHMRHSTYEGHRGYCQRDVVADPTVPLLVLDRLIEHM